MASYQGSMVQKGIQLPSQQKSGLTNDLYTAGIFWDECYYGRERVMISQEFYRIDSDLSKQQVLPQLCKMALPQHHIFVDLSSRSASRIFTV